MLENLQEVTSMTVSSLVRLKDAWNSSKRQVKTNENKAPCLGAGLDTWRQRGGTLWALNKWTWWAQGPVNWEPYLNSQFSQQLCDPGTIIAQQLEKTVSERCTTGPTGSRGKIGTQGYLSSKKFIFYEKVTYRMIRIQTKGEVPTPRMGPESP